MTELTYSILITLSVCFGASAGMQFLTPLMTEKDAKATHFYALIVGALGVLIAFSYWLQSVL